MFVVLKTGNKSENVHDLTNKQTTVFSLFVNDLSHKSFLFSTFFFFLFYFRCGYSVISAKH